MRLAPCAAILSTFLTSPILVDAVTFDCDEIRENRVLWNFSKLGGVKSVHTLEETSTGQIKNTTFTINICEPLKSPSKGCPSGSRICAAERYYDKGKEEKKPTEPVDEWPIAGNFEMSNGRAINPKYVRLKDSESPSDEGKEGVRVSLEGGVHGKGKAKVNQKAIIEFLCDRGKSGLEGPTNANVRPTQTLTLSATKPAQVGTATFNAEPTTATKWAADDANDDGDGDELPDPDKGQSLHFVSYKPKNVKGSEMYVLTLSWKSKYACEDAAKDGGGKKGDDGDSSGGWGVFTWFIIVLFLAVAAYLIFGSWLNYNRYGARGWDLLPHGDTIRDVPYLLKEWGRRVATGGGSRGGYNRI